MPTAPYHHDDTARGKRIARDDRATRFIARVDDYLPTLADDAARRGFLDRQLDGWERRYARFIATEGQSEPIAVPADPPQAADFLLTITRLAARRMTLEERANMSNRNANKPLDSAILCLLVAADQRCPGIIGHAHLLYHARLGAAPDQIQKTFAQLKREADGLREAVAHVEAALKDATPDAR